MQKYHRGFTLIELLISLFILSVAVMGYLRVDLNSQQLLQQTIKTQLLQQQLHQLYELLQTPQGNTSCPACTALSQNRSILVAWQNELSETLPTLTIRYAMQSISSIKVSICKEHKTCDDFIIQV